MLPGSLLVARRWGDRIRPVYASLSQENLEVARRLIQTYRGHVGRKKGILKEVMAELEDLGYDYRYVRGLSTLLDRRCSFHYSTGANPTLVRRRVFQVAHEMGLPTTPEQRELVVKQAAHELGATVEELEGSLYADLEDELILDGFNPVEPKSLIKQYNLSLTQTLLFYSTELQFTASGNWQRIFRTIKWLGLIYDVWRDEGRYWVKVDGPLSLFKLNRRYGTSLAKLLPTIVANEEWNVKAKILRRKERRLLNLELESRKHGGFMEPTLPTELDAYDSRVEQDFASRFRALDTGWQLIREPEPIPVGRFVIIPDFGFKKGGMKAYMEVVGFWTQEYLKRKIEKLGMVGDVDMMVAVDRELACQKVDSMAEKLDVIYYRGGIPLTPVLSHLKAMEDRLKKKQIQLVSETPLNLTEPVIDVGELAERLGVMKEAVREILKERPVPGYVALPDMLIKESKLQEIGWKLKERLSKGELSLAEASIIIEKDEGQNPTSVLEALGYRIEWHGIDPKSAKIREEKP